MRKQLENILKNIEENKIGQQVTIVCATKTRSSEIINSLPSYSLNIAGENRVQELLEKYDKIDKNIELRIIGQLQTNKVKYIIDKVSIIESVDSEKLALEIDKQAKKLNKTMPVLVQINAGGEENKGGVLIENAKNLCDYVKNQPNLSLKGLMCVFPIGADEKLYADCNELFNQLKDTYDGFTVLSMGMSADYITAIKNGANQVRLGSAIFGKRNYERIK